MFKTRTLPTSEPKCISIFMGKLRSHTQDCIQDAYGVENLSFEKLVAYFRKQEKQNTFKGLASLSSLSRVKVESTNTIPMNQKTVKKITSDVYRRGNNQRPCATCNKWGHYAVACLV